MTRLYERWQGVSHRAVDLALPALSEERVPTPPPSSAQGPESTSSAPPERDATKAIAAAASIGLMTAAKVLVDHRRLRVPDRVRPGARRHQEARVSTQNGRKFVDNTISGSLA